MNLEWLTTFKKVVESGSHTKAAEQLFISQPAVSQQLRRLEGFFGCRLFERSGRDFQLTPAGRRVYELAKHLDQDIDEVRRDLREITLASRQTLTVAGGPTPLVHLLAPALKAFSKLHPEVTLRPISGSTDTVSEGLLRGDIDIGVLQDTFVLDPSLVIAGTMTDYMVAACAPDHPLLGRPVQPSQLAEEQIAVIRFGTESRRHLEDWFGQRGVFFRNCLELATFADIRAAAVAGLATGFLSLYSIEEDLQAGRLCLLDIEGFDLTRPLFIVHSSSLQGPGLTLVRMLVQMAADHGQEPIRAPAKGTIEPLIAPAVARGF
jgi:DNA-binding transcriptional LysR family regulator